MKESKEPSHTIPPAPEPPENTAHTSVQEALRHLYADLGIEHEELEGDSHHLVSRYIEETFARRPLPADAPYTQQQALAWLANLAQGMSRHEQTAFYIEHLQPTWLPPAGQRRYLWMVALLGGLIITLFSGPGFALLGGLISRWPAPLHGLALGLSSGVVSGAIFRQRAKRIHPVDELSWQKPSLQVLQSLILRIVLFGFMGVVLGGLITGLVTALGSAVAIWLGLGFSAIPYFASNPDPLFPLYLSSMPILGLAIGAVVGINYALIGGVLGGPIAGLFGALGVLLQGHELPQRQRPNLGIWRSASNGLRVAARGGLLGGFMGGLIGGLGGHLSDGLAIGLSGGLALGLFGALSTYGGGAWIQHYTLRWLLARAGVLPPFSWRDRPFIEFLDAMHERILLRRVGGGWVFIHRTLQEYFAEQAGDESA